MVGLVGLFVITPALAQTGGQIATPTVTIQGQPETSAKPRSVIPKPLTAADLTGLQIPPDMVVKQSLGVPTQPSASNLMSSNPFNI